MTAASGTPAAQPLRALELEAPAKINLHLAVLGRRPDGFHELATVLQTVDLCDTLRLALRPRGPDAAAGAPDVRLAVRHEPADAGPAADGREVPEGADNLVVRAALGLLAEARATADVGLDLTLLKRIPAGGGLGGGSSDAAATLVGLNRLLGVPCTEEQLLRLAAALGSDVSFFLRGGTALCTGRGEIVEPIEAPSPFELTLFVPDFGTRTPDVYAALGAGPVQRLSARALHALRRAIAGADEAALRAQFRNDLQAAAARTQPALAALLSRPGLHLSGSGSTLFTFGRALRDTAPACREILICSRGPRRNA